MKSSKNKLLAPISWGELIDKITILEIKSTKNFGRESLENIKFELDLLMFLLNNNSDFQNKIYILKTQLFTVNSNLWKVEDDIRLKEKNNDFDNAFIQLARSVYILNDERSRIKKQINIILDSEIIEEKSYYQ